MRSSLTESATEPLAGDADLVLRPVAIARPQSHEDVPVTVSGETPVTADNITVRPIMYWYWNAKAGTVVEGQWIKHIHKKSYYYKFADRAVGNSNRPARLEKISELSVYMPITGFYYKKSIFSIIFNPQKVELLTSGILLSKSKDERDIVVQPLKKEHNVPKENETRWLLNVEKGESVCDIMGFKESFFKYRAAEAIRSGTQDAIKFTRDT
ncbi:hypothetical protein B0G81_7804 [Paraburkholderia sp. BL6665CI2N2]|uniref:hypothetical protein n=1 Tax=Paraburkholderia sp. BL6665CI2N2 TaxID=1938806 RepID=UPI0010670FF3|nr:hypothetical protein [Paraburkholderia sp. BL6665CI2N2]TDY16715.1 hypothetical protein B0G81_7804 [Paraburkholderia sp. BL6665CI2N2]